MRTPLCERLGIDVPIIQAAMGGATCPALAAAVSNAGGLGMLALSSENVDSVRREIRQTRALTKRPFGVNLILEWPQEEQLAASLEEGVPSSPFSGVILHGLSNECMPAALSLCIRLAAPMMLDARSIAVSISS